MRLFGPETAVASEGFTNRWAIMVPAFTTHLCLGGPGFGWSVLSSAIVREHGFVSAAATDWSLFDVTMPMPIFFTFLGIAGAAAGKWQNVVGPRMAIGLGGLLFGGGMCVGALGIATHSLPLLYFGFGVLGGAGTGLCYTPPMQALMLWFPDQKGLAMGCLVAGFGAGGLAFVPAMSTLMATFQKAPTYLGPMGEVHTTTDGGILYATSSAGDVVAAVQATSADLAKISGDLATGLYAVGSGSTGAAEALAVAGVVYAATLSACALAICRPRTGWLPAGYSPPPASVDTPSLTVDQVMRTPQFYQLGVTFACITCGIYGIFSVAKGMMSEVFSGVLPLVVTASFTSSYLMMLSLANLSGRFGMATLSDRIGCKHTYNAIILTLLPIYFTAPILVQQVRLGPCVRVALPVWLCPCGSVRAALSGESVRRLTARQG
jgi:MFS family permease